MNYFKENKNNIWFWLFIGIIIASFIIMPILSQDAGNSGDEDGFQVPQGKNIINYYTSGGKDTTCFSFKNLKYYGSSFDAINEAISRTFNIEDIHTIRHATNAICGAITILGVGLITYLLTGSFGASILTMLLLFFSPRFLGHSYNNPKDIPFAAAVTFSIYGMLLFFKEFPKVKWYTFLILILSIAFAISVRVGGLILFGYFGLLGFIYLILDWKKAHDIKKTASTTLNTSKPYYKKAGRMLIMGLLICIVSYFAGLLLWPYAMQSPIKHVIESYAQMSQFAVSLRQNFEGNLIWSDLLPWYYIPKFILITTPLIIIIGILLFFIFCWRQKEQRLNAFFIFFTFFFPIFWIVYTNANVYGGWRHALFSYPPMVVAAGWGFYATFNYFKTKLPKISKYLPYCSAIIIILLLIGPASHIIKNHPYEYIYFNKVFGGIEKAYGNYELDYYYHSTREATEWLKKHAEPKKDGSKIKVASWHQASVDYFLRKDTTRFTTSFARWFERGNSDWDYAIFTVTGIAPEIIKSSNFPPKNCVHTIKVDEKPICVILKRATYDDFIGYQLKSEKKIDSAITYFQKALTADPQNESNYINLIESSLNLYDVQKAKFYAEKLYAFNPEHEVTTYALSQLQALSGQTQEAIDLCKKSININPKFAPSYNLLYKLYGQQGELRKAETTIYTMIKYGLIDAESIQILMAIYMKQGLSEIMAAQKAYKTIISKLEENGYHKEAENFRNLVNN